MKTRLLSASAVIVLLVGLGLIVSFFVFDQDEVEEPMIAEPPELDEPDEDAGAPSLELTETVVASVEGRVTRRTTSGELVEVRVGDVVPFDQTVETEDGAATLNLAESTTVELGGQSAVTVSEADDGAQQLRLERGRTSAAVGPSGDGLRVTFPNSDAVAEVQDGDVRAITDGSGHVTVASDRGRVRLSARGESVVIAEGEESEVLTDQPPSAPRPVPRSFFLRVRRPPSLTRAPATTVNGQATPGAVVLINGEPTAVDANGRFRRRVPLREGRNAVTVRAEDVRGRTQSSSVAVTLDTSASNIESNVDW